MGWLTRPRPPAEQPSTATPSPSSGSGCCCGKTLPFARVTPRLSSLRHRLSLRCCSSYLDACSDKTKQLLVEQEQLIKGLCKVVEQSPNAEAAKLNLRSVFRGTKEMINPV